MSVGNADAHLSVDTQAQQYFASWTHGNSAIVERTEWLVWQRGYYTEIRPAPYSAISDGWVHIPIPTPVIVEGKRLKPVVASLRFETGPNTVIDAIRMLDAEKIVFNKEGLELRSKPGQFQNEHLRIEKPAPARYGFELHMVVKFSGKDSFLRVSAAGIDFAG